MKGQDKVRMSRSSLNERRRKVCCWCYRVNKLHCCGTNLFFFNERHRQTPGEAGAETTMMPAVREGCCDLYLCSNTALIWVLFYNRPPRRRKREPWIERECDRLKRDYFEPWELAQTNSEKGHGTRESTPRRKGWIRNLCFRMINNRMYKPNLLKGQMLDPGSRSLSYPCYL